MPCVSVIMPSLNVRPYIAECLESVRAQTLWDIEILCVDAGSTDGTWEYLQAAVANDPRIRLIRSERKSYGYQMNLGIGEAKGTYIGIVETDDYIAPDMYEVLYGIAVKQDLDILKADYRIFTGDGESRRFIPCHLSRKKSHYGRVFKPAEDRSYFNDALYTWSGIYRSDFLKRNAIVHNETPGASFQDNGFWFQTFSLAERVMLLRRPFYYLRRDNPGSSVFSSAKVYCECEEYDFIRDFLRKHPPLEADLAPVCAYRRFRNYLSTLDRIAETDKLPFLQRFSADFKRIDAAGELDPALFSPQEWALLQCILADPATSLSRLGRASHPSGLRQKLLGGIRCLQDHGLSYTIQYCFKKGTSH